MMMLPWVDAAGLLAGPNPKPGPGQGEDPYQAAARKARSARERRELERQGRRKHLRDAIEDEVRAARDEAGRAQEAVAAARGPFAEADTTLKRYQRATPFEGRDEAIRQLQEIRATRQTELDRAIRDRDAANQRKAELDRTRTSRLFDTDKKVEAERQAQDDRTLAELGDLGNNLGQAKKKIEAELKELDEPISLMRAQQENSDRRARLFQLRERGAGEGEEARRLAAELEAEAGRTWVPLYNRAAALRRDLAKIEEFLAGAAERRRQAEGTGSGQTTSSALTPTGSARQVQLRSQLETDPDIAPMRDRTPEVWKEIIAVEGRNDMRRHDPGFGSKDPALDKIMGTPFATGRGGPPEGRDGEMIEEHTFSENLALTQSVQSLADLLATLRGAGTASSTLAPAGSRPSFHSKNPALDAWMQAKRLEQGSTPQSASTPRSTASDRSGSFQRQTAFTASSQGELSAERGESPIGSFESTVDALQSSVDSNSRDLGLRRGSASQFFGAYERLATETSVPGRTSPLVLPGPFAGAAIPNYPTGGTIIQPNQTGVLTTPLVDPNAIVRTTSGLNFTSGGVPTTVPIDVPSIPVP